MAVISVSVFYSDSLSTTVSSKPIASYIKGELARKNNLLLKIALLSRTSTVSSRYLKRLRKGEITFRMLPDKEGVRGMTLLEVDLNRFVLEKSRLVQRDYLHQNHLIGDNT